MYRGDNRYDVIIIGCGLAGASLGYLLRKNGYRVLIVQDRKTHGKNKVCSGILTRKAYDILKEIYNINDLYKFCGLGIYNSFKVNDLFSAVIDDIDLKVVNRKRFDIYTSNQYVQIGGDLIEEPNGFEIDFDAQTVKCGIDTFDYENIVGADGVFSVVRQLITGRNQEMYISSQVYAESSFNEISFDFIPSEKSSGFGWHIGTCFRTHIGYADYSGAKSTNHELKTYLKQLGINKKYEILTAYRPTGMDILLKAKNYKNVFFVGDAAGLVSPLTGEGMYYSLLSSKMLYKSITTKRSYTNLMKSTIEDINELLLFKRHMHNFILRNIDILIMSKSNFLSKKKKTKIKKMLNVD